MKQYFKEQRALRTETVINDPKDVGVGRRLKNLGYLRTIGKNINHRLLALERTSHNCVISPRTFESVARILRPGIRRLDPDLPPDPTDELATAWRDLDEAVDNHIDTARIAA